MTKTQRVIRMDLNTLFRIEQLDLLVKQGPATFVVSIVNALIVYFVLSGNEQEAYLWAWLSAVIAFNALRLIMVILYVRMPDEANYNVWLTLYLTLIYLTGISWGILAVFPAFQADPWIQVMIIFVITGMSAGGIPSLYAKLSAAIPYFLLTLAPLIVVLALGGEPRSIAMSLLASFFLLMLIRTTRAFNYEVRKTIRLELENRDLFSFLTEARQAQGEAEEASGESAGLQFLDRNS